MARRKSKPVNNTKSILSEKLETGESIIGLQGYVFISGGSSNDNGETQVAIKVKVTQIKASGCGIEIMVTPMSGAGEFAITPCRWFDSTKALADHRELNQRVEEAQIRINQISDMYYLKNKREELLSEVALMSKEEQEKFTNDLVERGISANKLATADVGRYLQYVLTLKYNIPPDSISLPYNWNR